MRVANNLKKFIVQNGLTQSDVAKAAEVSYSTINSAANKRRNPSDDYKEKIVYGINSLAGTNYTADEVFSRKEGATKE